MIYTGEHSDSLVDLATVVADTAMDLKAHDSEFDVIATRGMSGVLVATPVALRLGKQLAVVRKDTDINHGGSRRVIGEVHHGNRYIFLDDFVAGGETRDQVMREMGHYGAVYVGSYLYHQLTTIFGEDRRQWQPYEPEETEAEAECVDSHDEPVPFTVADFSDMPV